MNRLDKQFNDAKELLGKRLDVYQGFSGVGYAFNNAGIKVLVVYVDSSTPHDELSTHIPKALNSIPIEQKTVGDVELKLG